METNCSETEMMKVLNRSLVFIPYPDIGDFNNFKKAVTTIATQLIFTFGEDAYVL